MKRMRLKKPVEIVKGHLFVILIVIAISLRCEAASPHSIEKTKKEISLQQSQYSNNTKDVTLISRQYAYSCSDFERLCRPEQICLPMSFNCDFFNDCSDGSDESECEQSSISQEKCDDDTFFQCEITKRCIPKKWLCDDEPDCGYIQHNGIIDISDELNCTKKCSDDEIPCSNGVCLSISKFCDKHVDCTNDEDLSICNESQCKTLKCDYDCRMTPQGPKCFCPPNQITENITKCAHPKKCRENSCDQICNINNNGEEICSCHFGYSKEGRKCVSIDNEKIFIMNSQALLDVESSEIVANFSSACDMEINFANNSLCVLERSEISCFNVSNFKQKSWKLSHPQFFPLSQKSPKLFISNFAIDWISSNFYLMDSTNQIIILCNSNMKHCRTVVSNLGSYKIKLQDFVIDPTEGFIFLSKFNSSSRSGTEILRFLMDGSDKLSLFEEKLFHPKDLTLDVAMKKIYFLDNSLEFIQQSDYNGKNRKFLTNIHPMMLQRIVFFENIFFAINGSFSLMQIDKSTNRIERTEMKLNPKILRVFAREIQPKLLSATSNVCTATNNKCDQLCVPLRIESSTTTNITSKCLCSEGFDMENGKCVLRRAKKLLFFVQKNPQSLRAIDVENVEMKVIVPIVGLDSDTTYDVDMRNRRIYFASHPDASTFHYGADVIEFRSFDGMEKGMLKGNFGSIQSMAYDWRGKNIFFTTGTPRARIAVVRVDRLNETTIIRTLVTKNIVKPTTIALSPDDGLMFWSSSSDNFNIGGKIEMAWMDGSSRSLIASKETHHEIFSPVSLIYHKTMNKLFWYDIYTRSINSITLGENRIKEQIFETSTYVQSYSILDNKFIWTHPENNDVLIADINNILNNTQRKPLLLPNEKVFSLKSFTDDNNSKDVKIEMQVSCPGIYLQTPTNGTCYCADGFSKNGLGNLCIKSSTPTIIEKANCSESEFSCKSLGECINHDYVCDGFNDCSDKSDEELVPLGPCPSNCGFKCDGSRCIELHQLCDDIHDCTDGSDESDEKCREYTSETDYCDEFTCKNNNCVEYHLLCDNIDNCGDNSDEKDCDVTSLDSHEFVYDDNDEYDDIKFILEFDNKACKSPELYCEKDRKCISMHQLCDGKWDCSDGSDEGGKCGERICDVFSDCQFFCHNIPTESGVVCYCPEHLTLDSDGKSCISPDICEEFSCSHICETLSPKKTRCRCSFGYQLKEDNFTCESMDRKDPILMFSSRQSLKGFKLNKKHQETRNFYQKGVNIVGFDFYFDQETKDYTIFWSDIKTNEISSGVIVNEEIQHLKTIVKSHLSHVESVAIDWIGKNLYWLDSILKHIDVTTKDGMHRATLISEDISKPRSLAIDSRFAYLFWSDWDGENPRIERATLAGEDRKSIFNISSKAGGWANGITLDFVKKRIFYVDAKTKEIHTINYDGENFKRITRDTEFLPHPYAITAFENNLYWTDWRLSGVGRCDKFTGNNIEIFLNASHQLFDIKLIHSSRQPIDFNGEGKSKSISSPCDKARCSHLCLLSTSTTFKCGCPRMMRLKANSNETCENINRMVFYISENAGEIRAFDFDYPNSSSLLTIYDELKIFQPTILDTHPTDMRVFWFDKQVREINSMKLATSIAPSSESIENIFDTDVDEISSFAIDWSSNLMFFSVRRSVQNEPKTFELRCSNTKGEYLTVILDNLNIINNLTVSTRRRKIYFVTIDATDDSKYLIKESNYDGSDYITIYYEDEIIESLVMDDEKNKLYFVKNHRKIFSFNLESKEAKLINTFYGEINEDLDFYIKSISLFENDLYFYENTTNSLRRCNKLVCHEPSIFRKSLKNIRQFLINQFNFISKDDNFSNKNQICYKSNRAEEEDKRVCEHLCMPKGENVSNFVCKCAMGYKTDEKLNMKCIPAVDSIIYIHDHEIRSVNMLRSSENEVKFPPLQHINSISYFDIDISRDLIYIADNERGEIYQTKRDGSLRKVILKPPEGFEMTQYDMFSGLAIDWIAQNLYFSDKSKGIIEFVSLIGHYRYVLLSQINKPSQINIDPMNGIIFFIDGNNKIMKHYLNESSGGNSAVIPVTGRGINIINVINDYVLDIDNQIIYACEAKSSTLWRIDYDGVSHKEIKNTLISNWISIDVMDGRIFWAERDKDEIKSMKVNDFGSSFSSLNVDTINVNSHIQKLKIMSSKRQFGSNACAIRNGNCLEICLSENKEGNVICLCAKGKLNDDKRTCKNYGNYLFFSSEKQFEKQGLDHIPEHPKIENSTYLQHAVAMTYDFERQLIFYSDFKLNAIFSCNFNGNDFKLLIDQQASVEGITWNSQNNELFWTMYKDAEIRSKRLSNSSNTVITILKMSSDVDKLRAIAVEPCLSLLYFSNWNKKNPTISRIFVTGYGKENVITSNIVMPNALALDLEEKLLFWADAKLDKLERCNYDGRNRVVLSQSSPKHPFALTVFKQFIYWSDWTHRAIVRINKFSGNDPNFVATNIPRPLGLFVAQSSMKNCTNAICSGILSGCEDVCLPKGNSFECHCTQGILDLDGRRCVSRKVENSCDKSQEYQCKSGECIPFTLTCDAIPHCSDSSDESRIFCATRKCPFENFYQCHDSRCISKTEVCDGKSDCKSGEDEEKCKEMGCKSDEFKCRDGNCIKKTFVCDYKPDCLDASDEIDCKNRTCKRTLLKTTDGIDVNKLIPCYRTSNCYLKEWECDGQNDCWDWSDERNCEKQTATNGTCPLGQFRCKNDRCILMQFRCDNVDDCEDSQTKIDGLRELSSDEMNCHETCSENQFVCPKSKACVPRDMVCDGNNDCPEEDETDEICEEITDHKVCLDSEELCLDGSACIPKLFLCDGKFDCEDKSDETEVCIFKDIIEPIPCEVDEFTCKDKSCIKLIGVCDLKSDCRDNSDENMTLCNSYPAYCKQSNEKFLCRHGGCINASLICNGADDCGDFSDEMSCNINECEFSSCGENSYCRDLKIGMECVCNDGFEKNKNNTKCEDINECENRPCSQLCFNTPGSYECGCIDGFIREGHRCRADSREHPRIIFAHSHYIKTIDFSGHIEILVHNISNAVAIDFDWKRNYIYFSDVNTMKKQISRVRVGQSSLIEPEILHRDSMQNPDGIAFDWVALNLYWCDKGQKTIEVSKDNGKYRKVLIKNNIDAPRGLALNPYQRTMYWTDWGIFPHIGRAGMDGSNTEIIVNGSLGWPNALTISFETNELFFGDAKEDFISVCDLDGRNRRIVAHRRTSPSINHIFAIATWDDKVYFSDWESTSIEYCEKYSGKNCGTLTKLDQKAMDIKVYHPFRQQKLQTTNLTTIKKPTWEIKIEQKKKYNLLTNIKDNPCATSKCSALCLLSPNPPYYQCQCPDYFYLDKDQKSCIANCTNAQFHCKKSMRCIPFFWKCDGQADCDSHEDEPANCPKFKCQHGEFQCDNDIPNKNATCLEPIQVCNGIRECTDGRDEEKCDLYGCFIESQFQCEKTANSSAYCISKKARCDGINDCPSGIDEKDCPQKICPASKFQCDSKSLCIPKVWICDGDDDCLDRSDEQNCEHKQCSINEFRCPNGRCIPFSWTCDSDKDCPDGSDEGEKASCHMLPQSNSCDPTYFKCASGNCIPGHWRCDHVSDCVDNSDEENCTHIACDETEFRCNDGQCINGSFRCDGHYDCNDYSDEKDCNSTIEGQCNRAAFICDGIFDCSDGIDEKNCDCSAGEFKCGGNFSKCIPSDWLCDGYYDCPDKSDEHDSRCLKRGCSGNAKKCKNGVCIAEHLFCDGKNDCLDSSDEEACQVKKNTDFLNVKTICKFGTCSQVCIEKRHGNSNYSCKCIEGYHKVERSNKTSTCLVNDTHFLTMIAYRSELSFFPTLDEAQKQNQISSHLHLDSNLPKVTSFDFLISNNQTLNIFCLNSIPSNALERIDLKVEEYRNFNYTKIRSTFLIEQSKKVVLKALSVDWITSKIYFVGDDLIKTMEIDGSKVRTIIDAGMKSWDIIVDPSETRQIFWSTSMREIYVASMDGSHRRLFLKKDIEFVYGFALDVPAKRLYWCDIKRSTIESVNLDGTDRQLVSKFETQNINEDLLTNPIKLDVFEDEIYFVMTDKNLYRINKFGKNLMLVKQTNNTLQASNIKIVHSVRQLSVKLNPCLENPCDKSAICYLSSTDPSGRSCNCPDNNFIQKNGSYVECLEKTSNPSLCYKKCANGGKCKFQSDKMICECSAKFEGEFCQNYICSGYCLNRGVCVLPDEKVYKTEVPDFVLKDKRICICPKDWGGLRCETPRMVCNITCLNGGTCLSIPRDGFNNEMCSCPTNFSGSRCQNCAAKECFNGGSCILDSDVYKCSCPDGFSGLNCEIDRCQDYCSNGGKCSVSSSGARKCECPLNFIGDKCEIDNRCENCGADTSNCTIHCHNGGKCIKDEHNNEVCSCEGEWKGISCNMLECVKNQCGKCQENSPINSCVCENDITQSCLPIEGPFNHPDVIAEELPNENSKTLFVVLIAISGSLIMFALISVIIIYIKKRQMRRFFNFSQLNENVDEITNPIFDLSNVGEDIVMPVTNVLSQGHFGNPLYETMYATHSRKGLLEKKSDDEDEFKSDLL